jgi:hypothetical protein
MGGRGRRKERGRMGLRIICGLCIRPFEKEAAICIIGVVGFFISMN